METLNAKIDDLITHEVRTEDYELSHDELVDLSSKCEDRLPVVHDEEHLRAILDLMKDHLDPLDVEKAVPSAPQPITLGETGTRFGKRLSIWSQLVLHVFGQSSSRASVTGTSKTLMQRYAPRLRATCKSDEFHA
jgi:hypothetical protein